MKGLLTKTVFVIGVICILTAVMFFKDPEGFENFLIDNDTKINIDLDGRLHRQEAVFTKLADGVEVEDRSYLAKKARLLHLKRVNNSELAVKVSEFGKAMVDAAKDKILDQNELQHLKTLQSDLVSPTEIENWYSISRELASNKSGSHENKVILISNN